MEFQETFNKFCQKNKRNCSGYDSYQPCYVASTEKFIKESFPVMKFYFNKEEIEVAWMPQDYIHFSELSNSYCVSVKPFEKTVLGAAFMINYHITINNEENKIQFVKSNCSKKTN